MAKLAVTVMLPVTLVSVRGLAVESSLQLDEVVPGGRNGRHRGAAAALATVCGLVPLMVPPAPAV